MRDLLRSLVLVTSSVALGTLVFTSSALADVIAMPPATCTEGSTALDFCHGPPTCEITSCASDRDCAPSHTCEDRDLCVREQCCSGRACGDPTTPRFDHVDGECATGTCDGFDTTCEKRSVCVPGSRSDAGPPDAGPADGGTDGAVADSGVADSGVTDSAVADSSIADSAVVDSAVADSGAMDSGAVDSGSDAGTGGPSTGGGCCSVTRPRSAAGGALFAVLVGFVLLRRSRR